MRMVIMKHFDSVGVERIPKKLKNSEEPIISQ